MMVRMNRPAAVLVHFDFQGEPKVQKIWWDLGCVDVITGGKTWIEEQGRKVQVRDAAGNLYELLLQRSDLTWRVVAAPSDLLLA